MKLPPTRAPGAELPPTLWGKILGSTPVVMTVVATMLAGLASSEMTRAQYDRSLAAQLQSKAGDQWSFFQAKKLRGALQHTTLDLIVSTAEVHSFDPASLVADQANPGVRTIAETASGRDAVRILSNGKLPELPASAAVDPTVIAGLEGLEKAVPDAEMAVLLAKIEDGVLASALRAAQARARALDALTAPSSRAIDEIESAFMAGKSADRTDPARVAVSRDFTAARLRYHAQRYDIEARHNQDIARLYELQVRKNNLSAERHHRRSGRFFYGMLAAQMAVIIATFALAARNRSFLWAIAAAAGTTAVAFAIYVYVYV